MLTFNPNRLVATHNIFITAATHAGSCRCWRCLAWWATLDNASRLSPFSVEEMEEYAKNGFAFTVTFPKGEVARGVMRENRIITLDPGLGDIFEFDELEKEAAACGWILDHPHSQARIELPQKE